MALALSSNEAAFGTSPSGPMEDRFKSSGSTKRQDAVRGRDQLLGKRARGEMPSADIERITCGELFDDLLEHSRANIKPSTEEIWWLVRPIQRLRSVPRNDRAGPIARALMPWPSGRTWSISMAAPAAPLFRFPNRGERSPHAVTGRAPTKTVVTPRAAAPPTRGLRRLVHLRCESVLITHDFRRCTVILSGRRLLSLLPPPHGRIAYKFLQGFPTS